MFFLLLQSNINLIIPEKLAAFLDFVKGSFSNELLFGCHDLRKINENETSIPLYRHRQ